MNSSSPISVLFNEIRIAGYQVKHIEEHRYHSVLHLEREQRS